jgi:hypothetical protein
MIVRDMEDGNMKTLITDGVAILAIALLTGPVLTQPAFAEAADSVIVGGKTIGADPDTNVRFQMRRGRRDVCFGRDSSRWQSPSRSLGK